MKHIIPFATITSIVIFFVLALGYPKVLSSSSEIPDPFVNPNVEKKNIEEFNSKQNVKVTLSLVREYKYSDFMYSEILKFNTDSTFERKSIGCTAQDLEMGYFNIKEDSLFLTYTKEEREFALEEDQPDETVMEFDADSNIVYNISLSFKVEFKIVDIETPYSDTLIITESGLVKYFEKVNPKIYF